MFDDGETVSRRNSKCLVSKDSDFLIWLISVMIHSFQTVGEDINRAFEHMMEEIRNIKEQVDSLKKTNEKLENEISMIKSIKNEAYYQKKLEKLLGGTHSKTKLGVTDISTKDMIYEIKEWNGHKAAYGQLKAYGRCNRDKILGVCFYGEVSENKKTQVVDWFTEENIRVFEIIENDGCVNLKAMNFDNDRESITEEKILNTFASSFLTKGSGRILWTELWENVQEWCTENEMIEPNKKIAKQYFERIVFKKKETANKSGRGWSQWILLSNEL